jgi:PAS domain S-box-containing protein
MDVNLSLSHDDFLAQLAQATEQGFWLIDNDTVTLDVNAAMCSILGLDRDEIIGRPIFDFVDDDNLEIFRREIEKRKKGIRGAYEIALRRADGGNVPCVNNAHPIFDADGNKIASIGLWTNITEIRNTQDELQNAYDELEKLSARQGEQLRTSEERYRQITQAVPVGIIIHVKREIVFANPAAVRIFHAAGEAELVGKLLPELTHPDDRQLIPPDISASRDGTIDHIRVRRIRSDGSLFWSESYGCQIDFDGSPARLVVISDISQQVEAEETAHQATIRFQDFATATADWF